MAPQVTLEPRLLIVLVDEDRGEARCLHRGDVRGDRLDQIDCLGCIV